MAKKEVKYFRIYKSVPNSESKKSYVKFYDSKADAVKDQNKRLELEVYESSVVGK